MALLKKYSTTLTSILATVPVKETPPKGKVFVYAQCQFPQCTDEAKYFQQATSALGWTYKSIAFDSSNPATLISAMDQALQDKASATAIGGLPQALWAKEIPKYQKAGAIIIPIDTGETATSTTVPIEVGASTMVSGQVIANEFIRESSGSGKALVVDVPDFPILKAFASSIDSTIKSCSGCSSTDFNATIAEESNNAITPGIVSALQRDPSIKYVVSADSAVNPGLPAALSGAGISGVKIMGVGPTSADIQGLKDGQTAAFVQENLNYNGLLAIDAAIRHVEGMAILPDGGGTPIQLFTSANAPSTFTDSLNAPANAYQQFLKLWKVG